MTARRQEGAAAVGAWRAAGLALAGLGLAACAQAGELGAPLLPPGAYALSVTPTGADAADSDLRVHLPEAGRSTAERTAALPLLDCLDRQAVSSLPAFGRHFQHRHAGQCESLALGERAWRIRCDLDGTQTQHEGAALIEGDRFVVHMTVTVGEGGPPGHLLVRGAALGLPCVED